MGNLQRDAWEGWTQQAFIDTLSDEIKQIITDEIFVAKVYKQICETIKKMASSICETVKEFANLMLEVSTAKIQNTSPKQYGISLMKDRGAESKGYNLYRIERKVQKHLPYHRRFY